VEATVKKLVALGGAVLFFLSCALVRGGLFDSARYGDAELYGHYAHRMASGEWPYRDFFDEYPPLAQPLFYVVRLLPGPFISSFRWTMTVFGAVAIVLMVAAIRGPLYRIVVAAAVAGLSPLLVGPVFLNTYDLFPAMLTIAAVLALLHRRDRTAYVLLALGVGAKVYPIVLLPIALVETWERGGRSAARRSLAWFAGVLVLVHVPFAIMGPGGLRFSYWVQVKRGLESESLGGGILLVLDRLGLYSATLRDKAPGSRDAVGALPDALAVLSSLAIIAAVAAVTLLYLRGRRDLLRAAAAAVTAFVAFNKVLSPQYMAWLMPLVPATGIIEAGVLAAAFSLTHAEFDRFSEAHGSIEHWGQVLSWWIFARDLVLVALFALLAVRLRPGPRSRSLP
jgi:uncharacterized membrane protein